MNRKLRQVKGELIEYTVKVPDPDKPDEKSYRAVVKLEGQSYTFDKDDPQAYPAEWILLDFEQVPVRALDDYTLEIKLQFPVPYFLDLMAFYPFSPVQRDCVLQHGIAWTQPGKMVSNGAYQLELRRFRERIRVVKNEHYWDRDHVQLQTVDYLAVEGQATSLNLYLTVVSIGSSACRTVLFPICWSKSDRTLHSRVYHDCLLSVECDLSAVAQSQTSSSFEHGD